MKTRLLKIKRFIRQVRGLFPQSLPTGIDEFNSWATDIAATYQLPTENLDSIRYTLATIIMHLGQTAAYKSKWYFVLTLRSGAAKQIAGGIFYEIKTKQQAAQAAEAAAIVVSSAT